MSEALKETGVSTVSEDADVEGQLTDQERFLPIANVNRIMKSAIPENGKIAKAAKECVQECVSEFISFITSEASEKCQQEKRKTINGEDILWAVQSLGLDNYGEPLKHYLDRYRASNKGDRDGNVVGMGIKGTEVPVVINDPAPAGVLTFPN